MIRTNPPVFKSETQFVRNRLVTWLKRHTEDDRQSLARFTTGGFSFAAGMMVIILADQLLDPSLSQEWVSLIGLILVVIGALTALWGYLKISLFKILLYLLETKND